MISTTFNGSTAYLIDDQIDFSSGVECDFELPGSVESGLTARETRRATGGTLRVTMRFQVVIQTAAAITAYRNSMQALTTQRVLVPFYPSYINASTSSPTVTAAYYVALGDGSAAAIYAAASLPLSRQAYPLLSGRLTSAPRVSARHDQALIVQFEFVEDDVFPLTWPSFTPSQSMVTGTGASKYVFPWRADWSKSPDTGSAVTSVERQQIGQGRTTADAYYTQPARRTVDYTFTLDTGDAFNLLSWFESLQGPTGSFWLPGGVSEANLTANVGSTDTALTVDNTSALGSNVYVILDDLTNRSPLTTTGVSGSTWTLSGSVGTAYTAATTRIETLILARFAADKVKFRFRDPFSGQAEVKFVETPWETSATTGETLGTTMGALPVNAYLYVFTVAYPGSTQTWRLTSYESNLSDGTNTYTAAYIEHDKITESDSLARQTVTIKSRTFSGNPLSMVVPFALEWPLMVQIIEADLTGTTAGNLRVLFYGEVTAANPDGPFIDATAESMSHLFDQRVPRRLFQVNCNWVLFSAQCGLSASAWQWTANVVSYTASTLTLEVNTLTSSNGATLVANFFAFGTVTFGSGSAVQVRMISTSSAPASGTVTLTLSTPLTTNPNPGDTVTLYPGCDGRYVGTCIGKFNNGSKHGGYPWMPVGNPSCVDLSQQVHTTKK